MQNAGRAVTRNGEAPIAARGLAIASRVVPAISEHQDAPDEYPAGDCWAGCFWKKRGVTTYAGIAAALNARSIKTARGRQWTHMQVGNVLGRFGE